MSKKKIKNAEKTDLPADKPDKSDKDKALEVHLAEMDTIRTEIIARVELQHQVLNYALALLGSTLVVVNSSFITSIPPYGYLVASIIMSSLTWAIGESAIMIAKFSAYIRFDLGAKIQTLIGEEKKDEFQVLKLQEANVLGSITAAILACGKYLVTYGSSIAFVIIYQQKTNSTPIPTPIPNEEWLYWLAIFAILVLPTIALLRGIIYFSQNRKKKKH